MPTCFTSLDFSKNASDDEKFCRENSNLKINVARFARNK